LALLTPGRYNAPPQDWSAEMALPEWIVHVLALTGLAALAGLLVSGAF
jgi:hypothetical protein